MRRGNLIIGLMISFLSGAYLSSGISVASTILDIPAIGADKLKHELYEGPPMVCANALSPIEFQDLTIRGSVNIPSSRVKDNPNLPEDKGELLVFFCKGLPT